MSRSIKFKITQVEPFTKAQLRRLYNISEFFSSSFEWSIDKFWVGPGPIEPVPIPGKDPKEVALTISKSIEALMITGSHMIDAIESLEQQGVLKSIVPLRSNTYIGICRVGGNESNARQVVKALSEVSIMLRDSCVFVEDEGHYLKTDIILREGSALPNPQWIRKLMNEVGIFLTSFNQDVRVMSYSKTLMKYFIQDCEVRFKTYQQVLALLNREYGISLKAMDDYKNVDTILWPSFNMFTRSIKVTDFAEYTPSMENLIGGYLGEYWDLIPGYDPETESYRLLTEIHQKLKNHNPKINVFRRVSD